MGEDDGILITSEPTDWFSAARRVVGRSIRVVGLWFVTMAASVLVQAAAFGGLLSMEFMGPAIASMFLLGLCGLLGVCAFPLVVWDERLTSKNRVRLEEVQGAIARIGDSGVEEIEPTWDDRLEQVLHEERLNLGIMVVLEACVVYAAISLAQTFELDASYFPLFLGVVGTIPTIVGVTIGLQVWRTKPTTMASARAERQLREAVKSKEELVGGLVLDEHARTGGELTMRQEVGGLAMHEEVALGLDVADEVDASVVGIAEEATA